MTHWICLAVAFCSFEPVFANSTVELKIPACRAEVSGLALITTIQAEQALPELVARHQLRKVKDQQRNQILYQLAIRHPFLFGSQYALAVLQVVRSRYQALEFSQAEAMKSGIEPVAHFDFSVAEEIWNEIKAQIRMLEPSLESDQIIAFVRKICLDAELENILLQMIEASAPEFVRAGLLIEAYHMQSQQTSFLKALAKYLSFGMSTIPERVQQKTKRAEIADAIREGRKRITDSDWKDIEAIGERLGIAFEKPPPIGDITGALAFNREELEQVQPHLSVQSLPDILNYGAILQTKLLNLSRRLAFIQFLMEQGQRTMDVVKKYQAGSAQVNSTSFATLHPGFEKEIQQKRHDFQILHVLIDLTKRDTHLLQEKIHEFVSVLEAELSSRQIKDLRPESLQAIRNRLNSLHQAEKSGVQIQGTLDVLQNNVGSESDLLDKLTLNMASALVSTSLTNADIKEIPHP